MRSPKSAAFRNLHTLKGNARVHGFSHLVDVLHSTESAYSRLREDPTAQVEPRELLAHLAAVRARIEQYEDVCSRKLAQLAKHRDTGADRTLRQITALLDSANALGGELATLIRAAVTGPQGVGLLELADETGCFLPSLAAELGKPQPKLLANIADHRLLPEWSSVLKDVLVQCFRNSATQPFSAKPQQRRASTRYYWWTSVAMRVISL